MRLDGNSLTFDYTTPGNPHWSVWLRSTTWQPSRAGEPERIVGEATRALGAPRGVAAIKNLHAEPARDELAKFEATNRAPQGVTVHLRPGQTEKLFDLKLVGDQRVSFEVELRPNSIITAQPAFQPYVRELAVDREGGAASASYEIVEAPVGFDLVLETTGANVSEIRRDGAVLTPIPFKKAAGESSSAANASGANVTRTLLTGRGETLQWRFRSSQRPTQIFMNEPVRGYVLTPTASLTLFSFKDVATGYATSATIKMISQPFDPKQLLPPSKPRTAAVDKSSDLLLEESAGKSGSSGNCAVLVR